MKKSFIYSNVYLYRLAIAVLRGFRYKKRVNDVIACLGDDAGSVVELCFGDIYIAQYCKRKNKKWIGFDLNESFVAFAKSRGYDARQADLALIEELPVSDVCVMMGSLYHFYPEIKQLFQKIRKSSRRFILSEPIINLTDMGGVLGFLAKKFTNAGQGEEAFRFNERNLIEMLENLKKELKFDYKIINKSKDIIIEIVWPAI